MKPVLALVGRPNVGKSTLFNCFTRSRDALVADQPGLTRDRKYGEGTFEDKIYIVIDTGGLTGESELLDKMLASQVWKAVEEADVVLLVVDARDGLLAGDLDIAKQLRERNKSIKLVINKIDGINTDTATADFAQLGFEEPSCVSAANNRGIQSLLHSVLPSKVEDESVQDDIEQGIRIAIVGKPNVGKSTLLNRIIGEQRVLTLDMPGTTRDSIYVPFERDNQRYTLIDTAGVRKRGKVHDKLEKFSVVKTLQSIEAAHVVILLLDAQQGVTDQDTHLMGFILQTGRAFIVAVNKWDGLTADKKQQAKQDLSRKLQFIPYAKTHFISALHGTGVGTLLKHVKNAYAAAFRDMPTPLLTRILETAVQAHQPPMVKGRRIKLRYAHQGGQNPPVIVIHGNQTDQVPKSYQRYLVNTFTQTLNLEGTPLRIEFVTGTNPFAGKKNVLNKRQIKRKQRLKKHVRRLKRN